MKGDFINGVSICLIVAAVGAYAADEIPVREQNLVSPPVGVVRIDVPAGGQALVSLPVDPIESDLDQVLGAQLSEGDRVLKWLPESQSYRTAYRTGGVGAAIEVLWSDSVDEDLPTDLTLQMGEGFWIVNRQTFPQVVYFTGHVALEPVRTIPIAQGLNLLGFPYSTGIAVDRTTSLKDQGEALALDADGKYIPPLRLEINEGFWYRQGCESNEQLLETRPYGAPFPTNGLPPQILHISVDNADGEVSLTIACEGTPREQLDVFYQDLSLDSDFRSESGWIVAEAALRTTGRREVLWTDADSSNRPTPSTLMGRFYLIARADIDSDGDGLPDAREMLVHGTQSSNADTDGDGQGDGAEVAQGTNPLVVDPNDSGVVYVNGASGDDTWDGSRSRGQGLKGPKRTIQAGIKEALIRHNARRAGPVSMQVSGGVYRGSLDVPAEITLYTDGDVSVVD